MKKRWIVALLAFVAACFCVGGFSACNNGDEGSDGVIYEVFELPDAPGAYEARVIGYTGKDRKVKIAPWYQGEAVTTNRENA